MSRTVDDLFRKALALSEQEREELVLLLTRLADTGWSSPAIEQAWMDECDRREAAIDRAELELIPAEEVHQRVREHLRK